MKLKFLFGMINKGRCKIVNIESKYKNKIVCVNCFVNYNRMFFTFN